MKTRLLILLLAVALASVSLSATGTVTVTSTTDIGLGKPVIRHTVAWTSHTDGTVTSNAFAVVGWLTQVRITPGSGGTQPTDNYDMVIATAQGVDVLVVNGGTAGTNLSQTTSKIVMINPPILLEAGATLDVQISAAGSAKTGTVVLYLQQ